MALANPASGDQSDPVIQATGLVRRFDDFVAVDQVDIHLARGEVFGLLGANGAGKTTAIRMLCGTLPPTAGEMQVAGVDMVSHPRRARARIGYVSQRFALYGDLQVRENLKLQAGLYGLTGARKRQRLQWVLEALHLAPHAQTLAGDLPLGFKRRLALGAALLHEPEVLFLDEPTSGVDPAARQQFWELIYDLAEAGIGILVTTHYMDEALFCDRMALMHSGKIIAEDTPQGLSQRPLKTPLLELHAADCSACAGLLQQLPEVLETIPHAGQLRIRLKADCDEQQAMDKIRQTAAKHHLHIEQLQPARTELEDVFVALLEEFEDGDKQGGEGR
jgi:ABC-2 type transport system ATP-binding protein